MKRTPCTELAELRSAYLDGALADADRERVLAHLVGCGSCRAEVEELRSIRRLLNSVGQSSDEPPASDDLSSRLISIAGGAAYEPVWSRPFRRTGTGVLPSPRRSVRLRVSAAALALGGLLSTLGVLGYAAAPPLETATVGDPTDRVRSEFASTLAQSPLTSPSVNALMMTPQSRLLTRRARPVPRDSTTAKLPVASGAAWALLRRAAQGSQQVSYSGTQQAHASQGDRTVSATVRVSFDAGQGSAVSVYNRAGDRVVHGFLPATESWRLSDQELLSLLPQNYTISGWVGSTVAGRAVTMVEASTDGAAPKPEVAARWWIDNASGMLMWQETYDSSGQVTLSAGFTEVTITGKPAFLKHLAPRLATSTTTASLTLSNVGDLASRGWHFRPDLAGLSLVRLRSDEASNPDALHLVYSDGVTTLSVFEQRGQLTEVPAGARWDDSLQAYIAPGTPTMATWQSGDRVFSVISDGPVDLVEHAVRSLPHVKPMTRTTMGRVHAGWVRIIERVVG